MEEKYRKVLSCEYLSREPWLTVRKEKLELKSGKIIPAYYVLEYPTWVNTIAITKEGQFVFIRQYRRGLDRSCYELCAGVCDPEDATPLDAAKRELSEETGYGNGNWQEWTVISANPSTTTNLTYCYLATDVERIEEPHLDDTEELTVHLFTLEEVKKLLLNDEIKQSLHAAPLWKYIAVNKLL